MLHPNAVTAAKLSLPENDLSFQRCSPPRATTLAHTWQDTLRSAPAARAAAAGPSSVMGVAAWQVRRPAPPPATAAVCARGALAVFLRRFWTAASVLTLVRARQDTLGSAPAAGTTGRRAQRRDGRVRVAGVPFRRAACVRGGRSSAHGAIAFLSGACAARASALTLPCFPQGSLGQPPATRAAAAGLRGEVGARALQVSTHSSHRLPPPPCARAARSRLCAALGVLPRAR